jgi:rubrerythrin
VLQLGELAVPDDPVELLRVAVWLERRAQHFFASRVDDAPPVAARLYRELAAEEDEHVHLLQTELRARAAGRAGLL